MVRCGGIAVGSGVRRQVLSVDTDVEAGLLKLFFYVNLAFLDEREKVAAQPGDFGERETMFCDVDGLAG